ncbi:MAG TPA: sugar kinase [Atribacteraceae bacterium]|nr:sugar kinase [Atribacteraceae bacterium]
MPEIISMGEALVEIMRDKIGAGLDTPEVFTGPYPSGAPAIFADCAARLGGQVGYVGTVGRDDFGKVIRERLQEDGVDLSCFYETEESTTGVAFVAYFPDGSRKFIYHIRNAASGLMEPERIPESYFQGARYLHVNGSAISINETWRNTVYRSLELARRYEVQVSFDPNIRPEILGVDRVRELCQPILDAVHIVFPSGEEAAMLTGETDVARACQILIDRGAGCVVLKRGDEGCSVITSDGRRDVPSFKVNEVDPTGAGDCFDAGFLVALQRGLDLFSCGRFANAVGALAVTRKGPMEGAPFLHEVLAMPGLEKEIRAGFGKF